MALAPKDANGRLNIDKPRWVQDTFLGRSKHFFNATDPRNLLTTNEQLEVAHTIVTQYRLGQEPVGITEDEVWTAIKLYDSALHPDTGEKQLLIGRMSAQVPSSMVIIGGMLSFYRTTPPIVFWQWLNQSFMAVVNYTNRSGDEPIPTTTILQAYCSATAGAVAVALGLNASVKKFPPIITRFVPFAAVAAANCINIPLMRQSEIINGVPVTDEDGNKIGVSKQAARKAVFLTVVSRIVMASPSMMVPPIVMNYLDKKTFMKKMPWLNIPIQVGIVGIVILFSTPLCCAIFPQRSSVTVSSLELELQESIKEKNDTIKRVYFNKGL